MAGHGNVCLEMCESMFQIPTRVACFILVIFQGGILDYYLVTNKSIYWYGWIAADVAIGFVFVMAFLISYRHLIVVHKTSCREAPVYTGSLPLGYFAWLVYSGALAARVAIIFKQFAWELGKEEDTFFGPNTLKITISMAGLIFMLLLMSHHDAEAHSERKMYIDQLTATVVFDILDSVDALDILFDKDALDDFPSGMDIALITIACANLLLPTLPLMTLSHSHFGNKRISKGVITLHRILLVFAVNLPLLIIRLLLWHVLNKEISIFPIKNIVMIFLVFHEMYEERRLELRRRVESEVHFRRYNMEDKDMCGPDDS